MSIFPWLEVRRQHRYRIEDFIEEITRVKDSVIDVVFHSIVSILVSLSMIIEISVQRLESCL